MFTLRANRRKIPNAADGTTAANSASTERQSRWRRLQGPLLASRFADDAQYIVKKVVTSARRASRGRSRARIPPPARDGRRCSNCREWSALLICSGLARVVDAMAEGALTPGEAAAIVSTLEAYGRASVFAGHAERLARLERRLREGDND